MKKKVIAVVVILILIALLAIYVGSRQKNYPTEQEVKEELEQTETESAEKNTDDVKEAEKEETETVDNFLPTAFWEEYNETDHVLEMAEKTRAVEADTFFFPDGAGTKQVEAKNTFFVDDEENLIPTESRLLVEELVNYPDGTLYAIKLDCKEEFSARYDLSSGDLYSGESLWNGYWDRLHLGYYLVQGNTIYRVREQDSIDDIESWSEQEIIENAVIVCNESGVPDCLGKEEQGYHQGVNAAGALRNYYCYYYVKDGGGTYFFEGITWEKGKGMVKYYAGYGALRDFLLILPAAGAGLEEEEAEAYTSLLHDVQLANCVYTYCDYDDDGKEELFVRQNEISEDGYYRGVIAKYADGKIDIIDGGIVSWSDKDYLIWKSIND